jgi:predicted metal-binding membrane protein
MCPIVLVVVLIKQLPRPLLIASAVGWLLLAGSTVVSPLSSLCLSVSRLDQVVAAHIRTELMVNTPQALLMAWLTMLLAMMPTILTRPLLHIWNRSLSRRRARSIGLFLLGYVTIWILGGAGLAYAALLLVSIEFVAGVPALIVGMVIAIFWQSTPFKQASLNRCHSKPPLSAFGLHADTDAARYGLQSGLWCLCTCWALMLLPLLADGVMHWIIMATVMLAQLVERVRGPAAVRWGAAWPRWLSASQLRGMRA